jgi:hypothetical protein
MTVADQMLAQHERQIAKVGQWIAIRRYSGTAGIRTYADTLGKAYMSYQPAKEFVGSVIQNYAVVIVLAEPFEDMIPQINTNDKLVTAFEGFGDLGTEPSMNEESHVSGGKESAIFSIKKRNPGGVTIAFELQATG